MNPVTPKRSWPTVLFAGTAVWCAMISMVLAVEFAPRPAATGTPAEPGVDVAATRLLADTGILVRIMDDPDTGPSMVRRGVAAAGRPLRLDIVFDPQDPGDIRLIATDAVMSGLGAQCLSGAVEPLIRREAGGGDRTYLAGIALESMQAAYEADRFGGPVVPGWLFPALAVLCAMLAWCSRRLCRSHAPARSYTPSEGLARTRRRLEHDLVRIDADAAETRTALAGESQGGSIRPELTFWRRCNLRRRLDERRKVTRARARVAALTIKLDRLAGARKQVKSEIILTEMQSSDRRKRFDLMLTSRNRAISSIRHALAGLALAAVVAATVHGSLAIAYPGILLSTPRADPMLFRDDMLIATALDGHPDLVTSFEKLCSARVMQPEVSEVALGDGSGRMRADVAVSGAERQVFGTLPAQSGASGPTAVAAPLLLAPRSSNLPICRVGTPCGYACIPVGRLCHSGRTAGVGQVCGRGYTSLAKTCRLNPTPVPAAMPVATRPQDMAPPPAVGTATPAPSIPPAASGDGVNTAGATRFREVVPSPAGQPSTAPKTVHVEGYDKSNGTHVQSYDRSAPGPGKRGGR